jgi:hypothetical protein
MSEMQIAAKMLKIIAVSLLMYTSGDRPTTTTDKTAKQHMSRLLVTYAWWKNGHVIARNLSMFNVKSADVEKPHKTNVINTLLSSRIS